MSIDKRQPIRGGELVANERNSLARGLRIVNLLIEVECDPVRQQQGLSLQQIAYELDVHRTTAWRLMQSLVEEDYAVVSESGRSYRLGTAIRMRYPLSSAERRFRSLAKPYLAEMVRRTKECSHIAVAAGSSALVLDAFTTNQALRVVAEKGRRVPLNCTSAGKCLMAWKLCEIPDSMPARTAKTITTRAKMEKNLEEIVHLGYALDDEENQPGVRCISAPVFDGIGGPAIGAIGIDGPLIRMGDERLPGLAHEVVTISTQLTKATGLHATGL